MLLLATMYGSPRRLFRPALVVDRTDGDRAFADLRLGRGRRNAGLDVWLWATQR